MDPLNVLAKFEIRSFPVLEIIAIGVLSGGCEPWGRRGRRGSGMVLLERALVSSYRLSVVTFPLSVRVSGHSKNGVNLGSG